MNGKMNMIYWKSTKYWLGRLLEHPEIMTQGETLEELEENIKDAYMMMVMDDVPEKFETKEIAINSRAWQAGRLTPWYGNESETNN